MSFDLSIHFVDVGQWGRVEDLTAQAKNVKEQGEKVTGPLDGAWWKETRTAALTIRRLIWIPIFVKRMEVEYFGFPRWVLDVHDVCVV